MLINPIINKENIAAISLLVPFGASLNSFQTKTPQIIYNPQNEMFRLLGTKRSFSQNETFFFSHP